MFEKLQDPTRPSNVHCFPNPKSWMTSEVMEAALVRFNRKLVFEDRKVLLFLYWIGQFSQIKIISLPNNLTSRLQPLDAGIIQNSKVKYRIRLVKFMLVRTQEDPSAKQIVKSVDVLVAIRWRQEAWKK